MSLENETRAEFAARMDKEGNSRADMIAAYYGLLQWYRGKDDELQEAEAEVVRLRAERDAACAAAVRWRRRALFWRGEAWQWAQLVATPKYPRDKRLDRWNQFKRSTMWRWRHSRWRQREAARHD